MACGLAVVVSTACGGSDDKSSPTGTEYDYLFSIPASAQATPGSIYGVWSMSVVGEEGSADGRFKFTADSVTMANRCHYTTDNFSVTVGIKVSAAVTASDVTTRESKDDAYNDGTHRCTVNVDPNQTPYTIDGSHMRFGRFTLFKVSD
jgi:hypothetical protein